MDTEAIFEDAERILAEIRRRIAKIEETQREIAEILKLLAILQDKILSILRDIHGEVRKHTKILGGHTQTLDEHSKKLDEHTEILKTHTQMLEEHSKKLDEHSKILEQLSGDVETLKKDVGDIKITLRRIVEDIEAEARDAVPLHLKDYLQTYVALNVLKIEGIVEINLYGTTNSICIVGDAKTRVGPSAVIGLFRKALKLLKQAPDYLRDKILFVVYGLDVLNITIDIAKKYGVCLVTPKGIVVGPEIIEKDKVETLFNKLLKELGVKS